jgi:hypothetical protein
LALEELLLLPQTVGMAETQNFQPLHLLAVAGVVITLEPQPEQMAVPVVVAHIQALLLVALETRQSHLHLKVVMAVLVHIQHPNMAVAVAEVQLAQEVMVQVLAVVMAVLVQNLQ